MHGSARLALPGLLLCGIVIHGAMVWAGEGRAYAPAPAPTTVHEYCVGTQPKHELPDESMVLDAVFYSGVFTVTGNTEQREASLAFQTFLEEHHQFHTAPSLAQPVTCYNYNSLAEAQASLQMLLSRSQKYSDRQTVVDTGWTYKATDTAKP